MEQFIAGRRASGFYVQHIADNRDQMIESFLMAARDLIDKDGADVIILAGAPLAGLARSIKDELPVPVVDGVSSAVRHAETLFSLNPQPATRGSFAPPPIKPNKGLPPALEALLRGDR